MIDLSNVQVRALLDFMRSAKSFLGTVETAERSDAARRDSVADDCEEWTQVLLRKLRLSNPE